MQAFEVLIQKFWAKTISRDELLELRRLLDKDDALREMLGADFFEALSGERKIESPVGSAHILNALHKEIELRRKPEMQRKATIHRIWWAAAASVILAAGLFMFMGNHNDRRKTVLAGLHKASATQSIITNVSDTVQSVLLKDGSLVNLYPNSSLSLMEPFVNERRDIVLSGMAFFKVAKDQRRPFTVFANGFTTTALGTAFTVDTKVKGKISVKLFEGKVVIRMTDNANRMWKDQYLLPNQEFVYNELPKRFTISKIDDPTAVAVERKKTGRLSRPVPVRSEESLSFNNEAMKVVFGKLEAHYHVKLVPETNITGLYFTGTFTGKEDVRTVLAIICDINSLSFTEKGKNRIEISKSK